MKTDIHFATGQPFCPFLYRKKKITNRNKYHWSLFFSHYKDIKMYITTSTCDTLPSIYICNNTSTRPCKEWRFGFRLVPRNTMRFLFKQFLFFISSKTWSPNQVSLSLAPRFSPGIPLREDYYKSGVKRTFFVKCNEELLKLVRLWTTKAFTLYSMSYIDDLTSCLLSRCFEEPFCWVLTTGQCFGQPTVTDRPNNWKSKAAYCEQQYRGKNERECWSILHNLFFSLSIWKSI